MKDINIILAYDNKCGIGHKNNKQNYGLSWSLEIDIKYFRKITGETNTVKGKNVLIMGRNTCDLIGKPLPNRYNMVITSRDLPNGDYIKCNNLLDAIKKANSLKDCENIFIVGGSEIYKEALNLPLLKYIYLTKINYDFECDINVPNILENPQFKILRKESIEDTNKYFYKNEQNNEENNEQNKEKIMCDFYKLENEARGEINYLNLLKSVIETGDYRETRNSKTYSLFGNNLEYDLENGFPLLTTKKMFLRGIFEELKFFMLGKTDTNELKEKKVNIWNDNTNLTFLQKMNLNYEEGDMGPMYGFQWRHFNCKYDGMKQNYKDKGLDQLKKVIELIKNDKNSRRIVMSGFNPLQADEGVLYPCHGLIIQFYIDKNDRLCCYMYQRSADIFLGLPFNIASYSLMLIILGNILNKKPGKLHIGLGDYHLYSNHYNQAIEQLNRIPYRFPQLEINKKMNDIDDIINLNYDDIKLINYKHHEKLDAKMEA